MKSILRASIPFAAMLALALGSVVFSCATTAARGGAAKPFFVNTGSDAQGRYWTVQAIDRVDRAMLIDQGDRSKRTELEPGQWRYDRASTEFVLLRESPYVRTVLHVEGKAERPARFALRDVAAGDDPFVAVEGRLAIRGFDYTYDEPRSSIVFREDFDPEAMEYLIKYDTPFGINSIGDWKPGAGDAYAYLEAQHYSESFARTSRETATDFFLDPSSFEGGKPSVIRRAPTPEEKAAAAGAAFPVMKSRIGASDGAVSKEVGFDARTPKSLAVGADKRIYSSGGKFIEESAKAGRLHRAVSEFYTPVGDMVDGFNSLMLRFGPDRPDSEGPKDERLMIEQKTIDAGLTVKLERGWGITSGPLPSAGAEGKPEAVALALFRWEDKGVFFDLSCADSLRNDAEALVRRIVEYRKKGRRVRGLLPRLASGR